MPETDIERPDAGTTPAEPASDGASRPPAPRVRERHAWPLLIGLTGLLGAVWFVAIATRYPNLLPG